MKIHAILHRITTLRAKLRVGNAGASKTNEAKQVNKAADADIEMREMNAIKNKNKESSTEESAEDKNSTTGTVLDKLQAALGELVPANNEHMQHEEDHLGGMIRKYIPAKAARSIARQAFRKGTSDQWRLVLPFLIANQDFHSRRVSMLLSLRAAYPERMQLVGAWLYMGLPEIMFQRLRVDIPELAPRNTQGYSRLW